MRHSARRHGTRTRVCGKISLFVFWAMVETRIQCEKSFLPLFPRTQTADFISHLEEEVAGSFLLTRVLFSIAYLEYLFPRSIAPSEEYS